MSKSTSREILANLTKAVEAALAGDPLQWYVVKGLAAKLEHVAEVGASCPSEPNL